ncbi:THAP domain-containing protein 1-like [Anneissia japonica]|uniref:THAP domain-containing protein 1-like n=1 Tax=Anneissia japonica TaxID=1529436 RepID=UPI0014257078|nr:THAP domain-containing protein 1-like [Anneissia japonica]
MVFCTAFGCKNKSDPTKNVSFHKLPLNRPVLLKKWLVNMRRDNPVVSKHVAVCSDHFKPSCFKRDLIGELTGKPSRRRQLVDDAVPTLFSFNTTMTRPSCSNEESVMIRKRKRRVSSENRIARKQREETDLSDTLADPGIKMQPIC